jgi:Sigma-70 region 2
MVASDRALVGASLAGERDAFDALIDRHAPRARALAGRMLSAEDAEDVVQEALLRAFLGLSDLRDPARFGAWLCGIALNLARMRVRDEHRELPVGVHVGPDMLAVASAEEAAGALDSLRLACALAGCGEFFGIPESPAARLEPTRHEVPRRPVPCPREGVGFAGRSGGFGGRLAALAAGGLLLSGRPALL